MRKLLFASAAAVGLWAAAAPAFAQDMVMPFTGKGPMPPFLGGNNALNSEGGPFPTNPMSPKPGEVTIHLNGRMVFWASMSGSPADTQRSGAKNSPYNFQGYFRLYPGVDGMATNGLRYGAIVEIRQNFGSVSNTSASTGASGQSSAESLYVRRGAIYVGTDQIGLLRLGQDDGPFSQFDGGVTTFQFTDGAWNGDAPGVITGTGPTWPFWSGIGNEYTITKAVYLSPQFAGFDFAASYAPNNSANTAGPGCSIAGTGCATLSTSTAIADTARAKDMVELMGRYRGKFGPVGVYGVAGYAFSGHVNSTLGSAFDGFSVGDFGLKVDFAGFGLGGNVMVGDFNGQVGLKPKGGKSAIAWLAGADYKAGPFFIGASYFNYQSTGSTATAFRTQRYDSGLAVSAQYAVAPGLTAIATYLYGWVHQGGINLDSKGSDNAWSQAFMLEGKVNW